jgi:hypothetical protein
MDADARGIFITHFGYDPFSPDAKTTLSVIARRKPGTLRVDLSTRDESGNVTWTDSYEGNVHCWALILTAGFIAEDQWVPHPSPPICPTCPACPAPPPEARRPPERSAPTGQKNVPRAPLPRPAPPWFEAVGIDVSAGISVGYGVPPGGSLGPSLTLGASLPWVSVGVGLDGRFALSEELNGGDLVPTSAFMGTVFACLHRKWFFGCGLVEVGHLFIPTDPPIKSKDADPNFAGVGLRFGGQWPITRRYSVRTYLDAVFPTSTNITVVERALDAERSTWTSPVAFGALTVAGVATF